MMKLRISTRLMGHVDVKEWLQRLSYYVVNLCLFVVVDNVLTPC